jgi:hypothetical protein
MKSRLAMALAVAAALIAPATATAAPTPLFRYSIDSSPDFTDLTRTAQRNGYVVLQAWRLAEKAAIKAANPNTKVLLYKNLSFCAKTAHGSGLNSTGVPCEQADQNPSWYLLNTSGQRFSSGGYNWLWAMDVGNADYQRRWADNVVSEAVRNGWDGVLLDDVNATMKYHYSVTSVAKYPSDAAYSAATRSALAHIGPRIQAAGKLAIANNATWVEYYSTGVDWLQFLSGVMDEMWLKYSTTAGAGYRGESQWTTQLNELKEAQRQGKLFVGKTQSANTDHAAARYGFATLLLGSQGRAAYSFGNSTEETPLFPEYSLAIGDAVAPEERLTNGVHRRFFTMGQVLVNPTGSTYTVALGASHSGSGLTNVSSVTLAPRTGFVLKKDGTGTEPTPTPTPDPTPAPGSDLALNRPASASSTENSMTPAGAANDGNSSTRWSSSFTDNQWWQVDLGAVKTIDRVEVNWEAAYASAYRLQTSTDGAVFTTAASVTRGGPGLAVTSFPARSARYVRLVADTRATQWGVSFWDLRVFGPSTETPPDTDPPETTISAGPGATTTSTSASFEFNADEAGSSFECSVDGGAWAACSSPKAYSSLPTGAHSFHVRATDAAGNVDPTPAIHSWTIEAVTAPPPDADAPETTITAGPSGTTRSTSVSFEFGSDEAGSSFECRLDGGAWTPCSSPQAYSSLSAGAHTFYVRATDPAGNVDPTPAERSWRIDKSSGKKSREPQRLLVATTSARRTGSVSLTWRRADRARRYHVLRNGRRIGVTRKRFFVDRHVSVGRHYRYRVVALGHRGRSWLPSRAGWVGVRA